MAVFDYTNDVSWKPRLLRSLMNDHILECKQDVVVVVKPVEEGKITEEELKKYSIHNPTELSGVVSAIKTYGLLSESSSCSSKPVVVEGKIMEEWKSTIDDWVKRLRGLIKSEMPHDRWAGMCLLGITCQECSGVRFLSMYSELFQETEKKKKKKDTDPKKKEQEKEEKEKEEEEKEKEKKKEDEDNKKKKCFQDLLQSLSDPHFLKVAACASLSDLFTRLGAGFPTLKKDATSKSSQLIEPILKLLREDASDDVLEGAADLLCTLMKFFPFSVRRHYQTAESVIVSKIMSGKSSVNISKKFAHCLALLPNAKGDERSWSLMMQKILISVSDHLSDAFQGLEKETNSGEVKRLLVPPGQDPPPTLGGQLSQEASNHLANRSEQVVLSTVSALMMCCHTMLTNPYPAQIPLPVRSLLALIKRVLSVDGSVLQALMPFPTVYLIYKELPDLHSYSLDLLKAAIERINSADIVRLLTEYFKRCAFAVSRIKVYSIVQSLFVLMGVGITPYLAEVVMNNALSDLDFVGHGNGVASSTTYSNTTTYTFQLPSNKKRKLDNSTGEHRIGVGLEMELPKSKPTAPISVQIAALQALESLLKVGGGMISGNSRSNIDLLLITVATNACYGGSANKEKSAVIPSGELTSALANFQLAALHALLASLLCPAYARPPYFSQGLELFRRGRQQMGTGVAEFCVHALLVLEVVIHPRTLPLTHYHSTNHDTFDEGYNRSSATNAHSGSDQHKTLFSRGALGMDDLDHLNDDPYKSWLGNGEETEAPINNADLEMKDAGEPLRKDIQQADRDVELGGSRDKFHVGSQRPVCGSGGVTDKTHRVEVPVSGSADNVGTSIDKGAEMKGTLLVGEQEMDMMETSGVLSDRFENVSSNTISAGDSTVAVAGATCNTTGEPFLRKGKESEIYSDSDSDSFPDIVDGDPDTV